MLTQDARRMPKKTTKTEEVKVEAEVIEKPKKKKNKKPKKKGLSTKAIGYATLKKRAEEVKKMSEVLS